MWVKEQGIITCKKRRIAIARAILKSPKILLLDEATSALDTESERIVQEALDMASMGRTTIVIAHRLSTIRNADIIVVMQSGEIMELGPHDELIANENGLYSSLVRLQQTRDSNEIDQICVTGSKSAVEQSNSHIMTRRFSTVSRSSSARSLGDARDAENTKKQKLPVPSFRRLLMLNAPEWKQSLMGGSSAILFGGIQPTYSYTLGNMISAYFLTDHAEIKDKTRTNALIFLGLAVLSFFLNIGQHYNFGPMGEYLTKRIKEQMLAKILTFEIGWFDHDENSSGALCSQLAKDANILRSLVGDRMALMIQTISTILIGCTMGLIIAWRLALVMIAVQPLIIVCFYVRRVLVKTMSKKSKHAQAESSKLAAEAVSNLQTVTAFSSQERILRLFNQAQDGPRKESIRQSWFAGLGLGTPMSLMICTWALELWYCGRLVADHQITNTELFQTFYILINTCRVTEEAGSMTTDLAKEIDPNNPHGYKPEKLKGEVDIRGVDFSYPSRPDVIIFKGFTLSIQPGKSTAIVGKSGSGKSTIIGLIERFYDPIRGSVKIDGRDIKAYNLRYLRRHIGLVSQEPTLFAARSANAHDFISNLKDGYDTWCGERGVQLSGGQKQRIAIARAILKNPAILLLDEATSALDSQSEKVVQEALDRVMIGRTSVVVAHRLSTIQNCDLITVLEKGTVVEKGTHASLMAKGLSGTYFSLEAISRSSTEVLHHNTACISKFTPHSNLPEPAGITAAMGGDDRSAGKAKAKPVLGSFMTVFMHADAVDVVLMVLGLLGAVGDGLSMPVLLLITGSVYNNFGGGADNVQEFSSKVNMNARNLLFLAAGQWVMTFLGEHRLLNSNACRRWRGELTPAGDVCVVQTEGYCWTRTAERQASRMRARYLQAVLRQDVEYFDLKKGSTAEVITSVSNDSLVVQDVLSEKVPNFVMNAAMFVGNYAFGFALMRQLMLVALPSVVLLIIPTFMYGRVVVDLARRIREQYTRPGAIAEQAMSSVRTVYSFVAERTTMAQFSAALEESVRLGLKQGLAKGVAIGSNGITFAILAFNVWYGSRLVMSHGYKGGTVFVVSYAVIQGGLALGSGLSNVKYFSEASSAAERILEVIRRVPKIDSESDTGEELGNVAGEVEFRNVEFCYPSRPESPIFVSFSLRVPAGRTVALVGGSGSGKSTVIALLERFYDPSAGEVMVDGVDIRRLRLKWLRAQMGLVSQEPALFATSIRENILFGKEDATAEEVVAAAKAANAHSFISQLPQGYDTQLQNYP
uniref:Multidrug resistance protein n=1 Tax=Oryza glumipatula TaxID=40148 RepID=A0A0D9YNJ0_9ORYZ